MTATGTESGTERGAERGAEAAGLRRSTGSWRTVGLIASREISTRSRSALIRISTIVMVAGVIALAVGLHFVHTGPAPVRVAFAGQAAASAAPVTAVARAAGQPTAVRPVSSEAAGEREVASGSLDALVTGTQGRPAVLVKTTVPGWLEAALSAVAREQALNGQIARLGGSPSQVDTAVAAAGVTIRRLKPPASRPTARIVLGIVAGALIYTSLMMYGQLIAQGVVEEKASRVVELLLATVRPWQLMSGKVLGIGAVGLAQFGMIVAAGTATALVMGEVSVPASAVAVTALWGLVWLVLGFFSYALLFAATASLASRQEDVAPAISPVTLVLIAAWVIGVSVLPSNPGNPLVKVLSMIPLFSPVLMPMRTALGAPGWQVGLALGLSAVLLVVLAWLAGVVYSNSVLRTGSRVRLGEALRRAS
jgi:ABC-2 type transport system permease protein